MSQNWKDKSRSRSQQRGRGRGKAPNIYDGNHGINYNSRGNQARTNNGSNMGRNQKPTKPKSAKAANKGDNNGTWRDINGRSYSSEGKTLAGGTSSICRSAGGTSGHRQNHRGTSKMNNGRGIGRVRGKSNGFKGKGKRHSFKAQKDLRNLIAAKRKSMFQGVENVFQTNESFAVSFEETPKSPEYSTSKSVEDNHQSELLLRKPSDGSVTASPLWELVSRDCDDKDMKATAKLRPLMEIKDEDSSLVDLNVQTGIPEGEGHTAHDKILFNLANHYKAKASEAPTHTHIGFGLGYGPLPSGRFY